MQTLKNNFWIIPLLLLVSPFLEPFIDQLIGDNDGIVTKWGFHEKIINIQIWGTAISLIIWSYFSKNFLLINLTATVWVWLILEILFSFSFAGEKITSSGTYGDFFKKDDTVGFKFRPSVSGTSTKIAFPSDTIYDVIYDIDQYSRRLSTNTLPDSTANYALFFGGSFTFGEGLENPETIPSKFAAHTKNYNGYNYGMPGCGPLQMHALLENNIVKAQIKEKHGMAIFNFIHGHINRTVGSIRFVNTYGKWQPNYELKDGEFIRNGNQFHAYSKVTQHLLEVLYKSHILDYAGILDVPLLKGDALDFTAQFFRAAADLYKQQFGNDNFHVAIYPGETNAMKPYFEKYEVKVIDLSNLFGATAHRLHPTDLHPTAEGNERYVIGLIKALDAQANTLTSKKD